jgi:hypothetical protein
MSLKIMRRSLPNWGWGYGPPEQIELRSQRMKKHQDWASAGSDEAQQALVVLALCVGGMVLARAVGDQVLADELRDTVHKHVFMTAGWGNGPSC